MFFLCPVFNFIVKLIISYYILYCRQKGFQRLGYEYNNMVIQFPSSIIAGMFNFTFRESFTVSEEEAKPVNVGNLFKQ